MKISYDYQNSLTERENKLHLISQITEHTSFPKSTYKFLVYFSCRINM